MSLAGPRLRSRLSLSKAGYASRRAIPATANPLPRNKSTNNNFTHPIFYNFTNARRSRAFSAPANSLLRRVFSTHAFADP